MSFPAPTTPLASSVPEQSPIAALNNTHSPHLNPFVRSGGRRRFTVSGAAGSSHNLPICETHNRGILVGNSGVKLQSDQVYNRHQFIEVRVLFWFQIYCRTDGVCICPDCETEDHPDHDTVSIETEWMENKV